MLPSAVGVEVVADLGGGGAEVGAFVAGGGGVGLGECVGELGGEPVVGGVVVGDVGDVVLGEGLGQLGHAGGVGVGGDVGGGVAVVGELVLVVLHGGAVEDEFVGVEGVLAEVEVVFDEDVVGGLGVGVVLGV